MKTFTYRSLRVIHPEWDTNPAICSWDALNRVDALSVFDKSGVFCVVYCKDFGPIPREPHPGSLIREPLEWNVDILDLAQGAQCQRFRTDYSWRVSNAKFLTPGGGRRLGLIAWIQEESARAGELLAWMRSSQVEHVRELLQ